MSDTDFVGSVPEIYDKYMVPLIFAAYAEDLARRVVGHDGADILETAAGSGAVTRALARILPPEARLTVTDINPPMLDRARSLMQEDPRIRWKPCDALDLPFADGSFDVVACQFAAMFFPDRVKGYAEARRVLRPRGLYALNIWDRIEASPFAKTVEDALRRAMPEGAPDFMSRTPHGHGDPDRIRSELGAAGFGAVRIERVELESRAERARDIAVAFCQGTPMRPMIEARAPGRLEDITSAVEVEVAERFGSGPMSAPMAAFVIEARA